MRIDILTCLPDLLESPLNQSIVKRAQTKNLVEIHIHNLRDYAIDKHQKTDDYPYGGGAGMVMLVEPISRCIESLTAQRQYDEIIYLTPDGQKFEQKTANRLSLLKNLILLCGHYKGVDERIREHYITLELTIGDFVLSGGELPAMVLTDAIVRLIPNVLSDETSALTDSFQDGLLAPPIYSRPAEYEGMKVPDILLSGHDAKIEAWRYEQSLKRTQERRPDLLE